MKSKKSFQCSACSSTFGQWFGKCPNCGQWNSLKEVFVEPTSSAQIGQAGKIAPKSIATHKGLKVETFGEVLEEIKIAGGNRFWPFASKDLNQFFNNGLVVGSLTLLAGEPGLGKSTLCLQLLRALYNGANVGDRVNGQLPSLLYITAEESLGELARRSQRLKIPAQISAIQTNHFEQIEQVLEQNTVDVVILDSIQTIFSSQLSGSPGSVSQVSALVNQFLAIAKSKQIAIILVGHVTKSGDVAGPKLLEHMVDSVLLLEDAKIPSYRTLSFSKHRYGTTGNQLLMKMEEGGLSVVADPALAMLENLEKGVGVVYGVAIEKGLPLVVEVQALVSRQSFNPEGGGGGFGRREALGMKTSKLSSLIAVIEKYMNLDLKSREIYLQISGLSKTLDDDSLDLPIILSILSSLKEVEVEEVLKSEIKKDTKTSKAGKLVAIGVKNNDKKKQLVFAGRLTLSGKLRQATNQTLRQNVATKLGFNYNLGIEAGDIKNLLK